MLSDAARSQTQLIEINWNLNCCLTSVVALSLLLDLHYRDGSQTSDILSLQLAQISLMTLKLQTELALHKANDDKERRLSMNGRGNFDVTIKGTYVQEEANEE